MDDDGKSRLATQRGAAAGGTRDEKFNARALWQLTRASFGSFADDYAPSMGAAISYYTVFSMAPLLLIVIALCGFVFGKDAASGRLYAELSGSLGPEAASAIQGMVRSASHPGNGLIGTIGGSIMLLVGATTVFAELQSALNRIWRTPAPADGGGIWRLIRVRLLSFGIVLAIGFLLLVTLVVSSALSALGHLWDPLLGTWSFMLQAVNFVVTLGVITVLFALIYKLLPRATIAWSDVWIGAAVTALLFTIGKLLIGLYIGKTGVASGFGAAGSLVVILVWVYFSAQIFLLGAEFTWQYTYRFGSRRGQKPPESVLARSVPQRSAQGEGGSARDSGATHAPRRGKLILGAALASGLAAGTAMRRVPLLRALGRRGAHR